MTPDELELRYREHHQALGFHRRTLHCNKREFLGLFRSLGLTDVHLLHAEHLKAFQAMLRSSYSEATAQDKLRRALAVLRWAVRKGILFWDPTRELSHPKLPEKLPCLLTPPEAEAILNVPEGTGAKGLRDQAVLETLYGTGLRIGELHSLNLDDVCSSQIRIRKSKGGSFRVVPCGPHLAEVHRAYLDQSRRQLAKPAGKENAFFLSNTGTRLGQTAIRKTVQHYGRLAGVNKKITAHSWRHAFATHLLLNGASLHQVQLLLGHAHPQSTERYTRLLPLDVAIAVRRYHPRGRMKS